MKILSSSVGREEKYREQIVRSVSFIVRWKTKAKHRRKYNIYIYISRVGKRGLEGERRENKRRSSVGNTSPEGVVARSFRMPLSLSLRLSTFQFISESNETEKEKKRRPSPSKKKKEERKGNKGSSKEKKLHVTAESCWLQRNNTVPGSSSSSSSLIQLGRKLHPNATGRKSVAPRVASNLGAESARAEEKEAWRSGRFWLNAFIGDAPGEKNQSPQSRRTAIVPVGGRGRTRERRVESKGCEGGLRGGRGCEPFLRHYVIRRFPGGIPTASTDDESRNFVATKRFLPGNNNTPPSPSFCTYPPLLAILEG